MAKCGRAAFAILLLTATSADAADPVTAEQVIERYRETFPTIDDLDCPPAKSGEILVCARRDSSQDHRLPLPIAEPARRARGDTPLPTEHDPFKDPYACVSHRGCAKATIPIFSTGRRAPGAPKPLVDIIANAINNITQGD